jgi:hypothetical protein
MEYFNNKQRLLAGTMGCTLMTVVIACPLGKPPARAICSKTWPKKPRRHAKAKSRSGWLCRVQPAASRHVEGFDFAVDGAAAKYQSPQRRGEFGQGNVHVLHNY